MTNNEILARWQGKCYHVSDWGQTDCKYCGRTNDPRYFDFDSINPDYLNDDAAAMSLLDTLVEKKYDIFMDNASAAWSCEIYPNNGDARLAFSYGKPTRREAVVEAVLELIGKEDV